MKLVRKLLNKIRGVQSLDRLKKRGLIVGKNLTLMGECIIDPSHCWHIEIGDNVIIAPRVHILAHDASTKLFMDYTRVANVKIGNNVFIGAGSIILPGVTIGDNVVIGAGSVVNKDIPANSLAAGVPAKVADSLDNYVQKQKAKKNDDNSFSKEYTLRNKDFSMAHRTELLEKARKYGQIFIE